MVVILAQLELPYCAVVFDMLKTNTFILAQYGMTKTLMMSHVHMTKAWDFMMFKNCADRPRSTVWRR